jgi:hypothetical protein
VSIISHDVQQVEWIDGKLTRVMIHIEIDLERLASQVAYHVVHGAKHKVTRARGAIVATRLES